MILELDNILRSIRDIRRAILSLEPQIQTAEQVGIKTKMRAGADEMEFGVRALEYALNNESKSG